MKQLNLEVVEDLASGRSNDVMPFPLGIFPKVVRDYIIACAESLNLVQDFMGIGVLSAVATLIGNSYRIQVKAGWTERPIFWFAIVGHSGIRKSPSLDAVIHPLQKIDQILYSNYLEEVAQCKTESEHRQKPVPKQLIVTDSTIEALIPTLKNNPNGILYFKDELIGWINDLTRYSRGSAEQQWLSLYSNQAIRLNRKTDDENYRVANPFANVLGAIQPDILSTLFENGRSVNGFTSRIAFSFPEPAARKVSKHNLPVGLQADYENFIFRFLHLKKNASSKDRIEPITLEFSYAAQEEFYKWDEEFINQAINDPKVPESHKAALSKMEALMPKLALVMQFIDNIAAQKKEPHEIGLEATLKAIRLTTYFYTHFLKVQQKISPVSDPFNSTEELIKRTFIDLSLQSHSKEQIIQYLLAEGFSNAEMARTLGVPKSNISYWSQK